MLRKDVGSSTQKSKGDPGSRAPAKRGITSSCLRQPLLIATSLSPYIQFPSYITPTVYNINKTKIYWNFKIFADSESLEFEIPTICLVTGCVSLRRDRR